ncbi:class I SAM-dependent methyltransferase [Rhodococcus sp. WMMA185]|uniref:class I SAM-dependent methyltransferase n=1 Tax=Rhodococcus sp. WMMA185 TaxID=679318 RepID=UPI000878ACB9|nr:class I SAM-dependent methyltransferase [Rhodococcus sp. WMMA185]
MATDYSEGRYAEHYQEAKKSQSWRSQVETYSFLKLIGDVRGKNVLDVACGEGHFTRILRRAGASKMVGIDISDRMVELAREQEAREPLGIEYRVEDARLGVANQNFDLAVSAWLLCYARDRVDLARMCSGVASRLDPGGRFVTVTMNPALYSFRPLPSYRKYGVEFTLADRMVDGAKIQATVHLDATSFLADNYSFSSGTYDSELAAAGFRDVTVHTPELEPCAGAGNIDYWQELLEYPFFIFIDCVKG